MQLVSIFIAYSHSDKELKDKLRRHLKPLLPGRAEIWDDYDIAAGQNWDESIKENLHRADVVLLLVSPDSLASDYFYGQEVRISLERHARKEAVVVPVILRPCQWQLTPLRAIEALPDKGKPVTDWANLDAALNNVAEALDKIVGRRLARQKVPPAPAPPPPPVVRENVRPEVRRPSAPPVVLHRTQPSSQGWVRWAVLGTAVVAAFAVLRFWPVNEEKAWINAQAKHTIPAYETYIDKFPNGQYSEQARDSFFQMKIRVNNYLNDARVMKERLPKDAADLLRKAQQLNPDDDRIRPLLNQIEQ